MADLGIEIFGLTAGLFGALIGFVIIAGMGVFLAVPYLMMIQEARTQSRELVLKTGTVPKRF